MSRRCEECTCGRELLWGLYVLEWWMVATSAYSGLRLLAAKASTEAVSGLSRAACLKNPGLGRALLYAILLRIHLSQRLESVCPRSHIACCKNFTAQLLDEAGPWLLLQLRVPKTSTMQELPAFNQ